MDIKFIKQFEITEDMMFKSDDRYNSYKTPEEPDLIWWKPNTYGEIEYPIIVEKYEEIIFGKPHFVYSEKSKVKE